MQTETIDAPRYREARDSGTVTDQSGYHQPGGTRPHCGCSLDTEKGAYRDVTVEMPDGRTAHFYHQSPVVVQKDGQYRLDSHGYRTSTTKERINRYLPTGFRVFQEDYEWYLSGPGGGRKEFHDGMIIHPN
jgi:hypothetical protein